MAKVKFIIDNFISYFISKKLLVFLIASAFLIFSFIGEDSWLVLTGIYLGGQSVIDSVATIIKKRNNSSDE